jgi:hypothetical protein
VSEVGGVSSFTGFKFIINRKNIYEKWNVSKSERVMGAGYRISNIKYQVSEVGMCQVLQILNLLSIKKYL